MDVVPVGPGFAAELRGVTLSDVVNDDAAYRAVRAAFEDHSVVVFRGQQVTDDLQIDFSKRFGPLEITKVGAIGTGTHLIVLTTIGPDGSRWELLDKGYVKAVIDIGGDLLGVLNAHCFPLHYFRAAATESRFR